MPKSIKLYPLLSTGSTVPGWLKKMLNGIFRMEQNRITSYKVNSCFVFIFSTMITYSAFITMKVSYQII